MKRTCCFILLTQDPYISNTFNLLDYCQILLWICNQKKLTCALDIHKSWQSILWHSCRKQETKSTSYHLNNIESNVLVLISPLARIDKPHQHAGQEPLHPSLWGKNCIISRMQWSGDNQPIGNCHYGSRTSPSSILHSKTIIVSLLRITRQEPTILDYPGLQIHD